MIERYRARSDLRPVLVCSGYVANDLVLGGVERGSYAFLQKPVDPAVFTTTLESLLDSAGTRGS